MESRRRAGMNHCKTSGPARKWRQRMEIAETACNEISATGGDTRKRRRAKHEFNNGQAAPQRVWCPGEGKLYTLFES